MSGGTTVATEFATSADGTRIAFSRQGSGPVLVLVDGAMCHRGFGPAAEMTEVFRDAFTVVGYDRRGRGESGDASAYEVARELDDLRAVVAAAAEPGEASLLGFSSGAALALRGAAAGIPMRRVVAYEAPYVWARWGADAAASRDDRAVLQSYLAAGKPGKAVGHFMVDMVGAPAFVPLLMRLNGTVWKQLLEVAATLPNDTAIMTRFVPPLEEFASIRVPVLVMAGTRSKAEMRDPQREIAAAIPRGEHAELEGQDHQVTGAALRPAILDFLRG